MPKVNGYETEWTIQGLGVVRINTDARCVEIEFLRRTAVIPFDTFDQIASSVANLSYLTGRLTAQGAANVASSVLTQYAGHVIVERMEEVGAPGGFYRVVVLHTPSQMRYMLERQADYGSMRDSISEWQRARWAGDPGRSPGDA